MLPYNGTGTWYPQRASPFRRRGPAAQGSFSHFLRPASPPRSLLAAWPMPWVCPTKSRTVCAQTWQLPSTAALMRSTCWNGWEKVRQGRVLCTGGRRRKRRTSEHSISACGARRSQQTQPRPVSRLDDTQENTRNVIEQRFHSFNDCFWYG